MKKAVNRPPSIQALKAYLVPTSTIDSRKTDLIRSNLINENYMQPLRASTAYKRINHYLNHYINVETLIKVA